MNNLVILLQHLVNITMPKRRIKHNIAPDFLYEGPITRRSRRNPGPGLGSLRNGRRMGTRSNPIEESEQAADHQPANQELEQKADHQPANQEPEQQAEHLPVNQEPELPPEQHDERYEENRRQIQDRGLTQDETLDDLLSRIYKKKDSPAAYSAALQQFIDRNYSLSLHKQRRKRFR